MIRTFINRWLVGLPPANASEGPFRAWLVSRLRDLERILLVLHPAIEHPTPTLSTIVATSNTNISSTSYSSLTSLNLTVTPTVNSHLLVYGVFVVTSTALSAVGDTFSGTLDVNGTAQSPVLWGPSAANTFTSITGVWDIPVRSMVTYTLTMKGLTSNALSTFRVVKDAASLTYLLVSDPFRPS